MKINTINKIYIALAVFITAAIIYKLVRYNPCRYYYAASTCAPASFPVYIREIYFLTDNDETVPIDVEAVNYFRTDWGKDNFYPETTAPHLMPEKLVIKYADFRDGLFYNDTILLPYRKLKTIYDSSVLKKQGTDIYYKGKIKKGSTFLVGIAGKGNIILWLRNGVEDKEVFRTTLKAKEPGEADTYFGEKMTKAQYLEDRFDLLSDSLKTLIRSGYEANANYVDSASGYRNYNL